MSPSGRNLSTGALLMLGVADLAFLNVWVFPRTSLAQRLTRVMSTPAVAVAVDRPVPPPERVPAERPPAPAEAPAPAVPPAAPEPASVPSIAPVQAGARPTRVFFAHNQHELTAEGARTLAELARQQGASARILIEGHADRTGVEVYNSWLSQLRAETVAGALAALGIDRQRMQVRAYGSRRPATDGGVAKALRRNRRVEISFIREVTRER